LTLPPDALKKLFFARLKRGSVLRTRIHFTKTGVTKDKFLVLLNHDDGKGDPLLFFITSSQLAYYEDHPALRSEVVFIERGTLAFFPVKTVVNCREVLSLPRADIEIRAGERLIEVVGDLPGEIVSQIDRIVADSKLISQADKKRILGA
jgi:hypothetical protein